jgi:DNA-binding NarL/FixJ family response regulator
VTSAIITVLIADDHPIFRAGLRQVIETDGGVRVVAEAGSGDEALASVEKIRPDLAVLDIDMPGRDGLDVARTLRDRRSPTRVIVLTLHTDDWFVNAALDAGVHGYVPKESAASEIAAAIRSVHAGREYVSPVFSSLLISRSQRAEALVKEVPGLDALTPVEIKVLKLLAEIKTTKEIADALCMSPRTVERHRTGIATKLELHGSLALTRFAVKHQSALRNV